MSFLLWGFADPMSYLCNYISTIIILWWHMDPKGIKNKRVAFSPTSEIETSREKDVLFASFFFRLNDVVHIVLQAVLHDTNTLSL